LRAIAKLDGKGFSPKNAIDPLRDRRVVVNEYTACQAQMRCAQGLCLLSCQWGVFSQQFPEEWQSYCRLLIRQQ